MILGTAQLGGRYGINNILPKMEDHMAFNILDTAYENGIKILDTGPMYGKSESVIGDYIRTYRRYFYVCTKYIDSIPDEDNLSMENVKHVLEASLKRLNLDSVYCYYLHQFDHCKKMSLMEALVEIKESGLIKNIGISIYYPEELSYICNHLENSVDIVQIPFNIFSIARWKDALNTAKEAGIKIFARSIYLQGLVFMSSENEFVKRIGASPYLDYLKSVCNKKGISIDQLCLGAVAGNRLIADYLIGCETVEQLRSNLQREKTQVDLSEDETEEILKFMGSIPSDIIDPTTWKKYKTN